MGKNRRSGDNEPTPSPMEMSGEDIVESQQTLQPTRDDKIKEELNDLYMEIYEVQAESNALFREQETYANRITNLESALKRNDLTESQRQSITAELNINRSFYQEALERYEEANQRFLDMNQRIYELETGDSGPAPFVDWIKGEGGMTEDEHGL